MIEKSFMFQQILMKGEEVSKWQAQEEAPLELRLIDKTLARALSRIWKLRSEHILKLDDNFPIHDSTYSMQSIVVRSPRHVSFQPVLRFTYRVRYNTNGPKSSLEVTKASQGIPSWSPSLDSETINLSTKADSWSNSAEEQGNHSLSPESIEQCLNIKDLKAYLKANLLSRAPVEHVDYLTPTSTNLLKHTISSFFPGTLAVSLIENRTLLPGHHLVYFPTAIPTDVLLPDGTDALHSPGPPFMRRLWAAGSIELEQDSKNQLELSGESAFCRESIVDVDMKGTRMDEKVVVWIERKYGLSKYRSRYAQNREEWDLHQADLEAISSKQSRHAEDQKSGATKEAKLKWWPVVERRKLVFLREKSDLGASISPINPENQHEAGQTTTSEGMHISFLNRYRSLT
jgi:hypothetical protein